MVSLKSSPGSQNGTGLLQTVIAMKVLDWGWGWVGWRVEASHIAELLEVEY